MKEETEQELVRLRVTLRNCDFLLSDEYSLATFAAHIPRIREIREHVLEHIAHLLQQYSAVGGH